MLQSTPDRVGQAASEWNQKPTVAELLEGTENPPQLVVTQLDVTREVGIASLFF